MLKALNVSLKIGKKNLLNGISLEVKQGEIFVLMGGSGAGKSTLLRVLNGLENPTSGSVELKGSIDLVHQQGHVWPHLTVLENITLALIYVKKLSKEKANQIAQELLDQLQLKEHVDTKVSKLSGGQKQRLAIARALAMEPDILCLDEPTSALDKALSKEIASILEKLALKGSAVIVSTHDPELAEKLPCKVICMEEGSLIP